MVSAPKAETMVDPQMFTGCVLAGCSNIVAEDGEICSQCRRIFGDMIRPVSEMIRPVSERERAETIEPPQPAATAAQQLTRRNQRCWLCEQRRTCTRVGGQWECRDCTLSAER
ncbi:hypothetical protein DBV08_18380 [Rhodococcus sp. KBW08]|uniref:hypothetical protein n=1 Tax=Rhodococcus sp. KBW08 TaxID=2144188 RepID=UPI000F5A36B5|nr:hypothetical protein [Rhodococcus sp. KBW08]RQO45839.1 hypothetical protein DBV08_18380 [Rhodococcus sp. KBW08]